jgi:para-nitrobenzyl esterase
MLAKLYKAGPHHRTQALARRVSGLMGCSGRLDGAALACLQALPLDRLVVGTSADLEVLSRGEQPMEWGPVVDSYAPRPFLPLGPLQAMKEGKFNRVPFISGTVKHDGALFLPFIKPLMPAWAAVGPHVLPIKANLEAITPEHRMQASILWQYYNHPSENRTSDMCLSDMLTDGLFLAPDQTTVRLMSKFSDNVYNYQLTQPTTDLLIAKIYGVELDPKLNPGHGDDIPYLFDFVYAQNVVKVEMTEEEESLSKTMVKLWTSFAKSGQPLAPDTVNWEPVTKDRQVSKV